MADLKISELAAVTTLLGTEEFALAKSGATKKITAANLIAAISAPLAVLYDSGALGADAASIDTGAGGIASGYANLMIRMLLRTTEAASISSAILTINNQTSANYNRLLLNGQTGGTSTGASSSQTGISFAVPGSSADSARAALVTCEIPFYADSTFYKTGWLTSAEGAVATDSNRFIQELVWEFLSATAISRLKIAAGSGNLLAGSRVQILGIG